MAKNSAHGRGQRDGAKGRYNPPITTRDTLLNPNTPSKEVSKAQKEYQAGVRNATKQRRS